MRFLPRLPAYWFLPPTSFSTWRQTRQ